MSTRQCSKKSVCVSNALLLSQKVAVVVGYLRARAVLVHVPLAFDLFGRTRVAPKRWLTIGASGSRVRLALSPVIPFAATTINVFSLSLWMNESKQHVLWSLTFTMGQHYHTFAELVVVSSVFFFFFFFNCRYIYLSSLNWFLLFCLGSIVQSFSRSINTYNIMK